MNLKENLTVIESDGVLHQKKENTGNFVEFIFQTIIQLL